MVNVRIGPQRHRPADQLDRASVLTLLVVEHAQQVQGLGVFLLARQNLLVQLGGRPQLPRSVHFDRGRQYVLHGRWSVVSCQWSVVSGQSFLNQRPFLVHNR